MSQAETPLRCPVMLVKFQHIYSKSCNRPFEDKLAIIASLHFLVRRYCPLDTSNTPLSENCNVEDRVDWL